MTISRSHLPNNLPNKGWLTISSIIILLLFYSWFWTTRKGVQAVVVVSLLSHICDPMDWLLFFQQEYWSGLPFPSPGDRPNPGIKAKCPAFQVDSLLTEVPALRRKRTVHPCEAIRDPQCSPSPHALLPHSAAPTHVLLAHSSGPRAQTWRCALCLRAPDSHLKHGWTKMATDLKHWAQYQTHTKCLIILVASLSSCSCEVNRCPMPHIAFQMITKLMPHFSWPDPSCHLNYLAWVIPDFVVAIQLSSCVWLFEIPEAAAHQASLSLTIFWSLPKFMSIELVMPSHCLILWELTSYFCIPIPCDEKDIFS